MKTGVLEECSRYIHGFYSSWYGVFPKQSYFISVNSMWIPIFLTSCQHSCLQSFPVFTYLIDRWQIMLTLIASGVNYLCLYILFIFLSDHSYFSYWFVGWPPFLKDQIKIWNSVSKQSMVNVCMEMSQWNPLVCTVDMH